MKLPRRRTPLRVGFLSENDCAPLVWAQEFGLFKQYGFSVELQSQASWKHVHNKIIQGQLDAAQAPATLPFLINLGLTPEQRECVSGLVLSLQGNALTVSRELWRLGVRDAATLRQRIFEDRNRKRYTFGITCPLSAAYALLCQWLKAVDGPPFTEVRIEPVPAEQLFPLLKLGYLDGYCAGEPWTSVALQAGVGACLATSADLAPLHPEKVLMVQQDFAVRRAEEHERLIAALLHACLLCEQPDNRRTLCELLAQPKYVNAPRECLEPGLIGPFRTEKAGVPSLCGLNMFHRCRANAPTRAKADWVTGKLFEFLRWTRRPAGLSHVFRPDIYERACRWLPKEVAKCFKPGGAPVAPDAGLETVPGPAPENWRNRAGFEL